MTQPVKPGVGDIGTAGFIDNLIDWVGVPAQSGEIPLPTVGPTNGSRIIPQGDTVLVTTDSGGYATIPMSPFPNSLISLPVGLMDTGAATSVKVAGVPTDLGSFLVRAFAGANPAANTAIRVTYTALGT